MLGIEVETDVPKHIKAMLKMVERPGPVLWDLAQNISRSWKKSFKEERNKMLHAPAGAPPYKHTGGFSRSIFSDPRSRSMVRKEVNVGSSLDRAALLQHGGVVKMKDKLLTIPIHQEAVGKRARDIPDLEYQFPFWNAGDPKFKGFLVKRKGGEWIPYFALMTEVRIMPHPWAVIRKSNWDYFGELLEEALWQTS